MTTDGHCINVDKGVNEAPSIYHGIVYSSYFIRMKSVLIITDFVLSWSDDIAPMIFILMPTEFIPFC